MLHELIHDLSISNIERNLKKMKKNRLVNLRADLSIFFSEFPGQQ